MFISRQVEIFVLIKSMHYPMQKKYVIYFYYVARLESDLLNQCELKTVVCKQALFEGKLRYGKQGSARCRGQPRQQAEAAEPTPTA